MVWIKISDDNGGVYAKSANPDPINVVSIDELNEQLTELNNQLAVVNQEPDEIMVLNDSKIGRQIQLKQQKDEIIFLLGELLW
ncbi:MAG: hypothetical protein K0A90_00190 [Methanosarcinaceae archaeon]|nr:hypothetical protein [Methanosarcinaceae archaeon]